MTGDPSLVCVPGLGLASDDWGATGSLLAALIGAHDVSVRELPGYGVRPTTGEDLRPQSLGARLADGLPSSTVLLGHSASCQVAAHAAASAPEKVDALVLVGPTTDPRGATWSGLAGRWLRTAAFERPWQVPQLMRDYTRTGLGSMARAMEAARSDDLREPLRAVGAPVLVVRGRHDRICPDDWAREVAASTRDGGHVVTLRSGAHMVPLTHPDAVARAAAAWIEGRQASASVASSTNAGSSSRSP